MEVFHYEETHCIRTFHGIMPGTYRRERCHCFCRGHQNHWFSEDCIFPICRFRHHHHCYRAAGRFTEGNIAHQGVWRGERGHDSRYKLHRCWPGFKCWKRRYRIYFRRKLRTFLWWLWRSSYRTSLWNQQRFWWSERLEWWYNRRKHRWDVYLLPFYYSGRSKRKGTGFTGKGK